MARPDGASELVERPHEGRTFSARRRVRLADADSRGRLRLDSLFRYAQDVATDDAREVLPDGPAWVIRRALVEVDRHPVEGEMVELVTWCGGYGRSWAERRTSLVGDDGGGRIELAALWVALDPVRGTPVALPDRFGPVYASAAGRRQVTAKLRHPPPPPSAAARPWVFRAADEDVLAHVNNAAYWTVVEELLDARPDRLGAEAEFRSPVEAGDQLTLRHHLDHGVRTAWLTTDETVHASLRLWAR